MNIVTISERADSDPVNTAPDAPIWQDSNGVLYRIASGQLDTVPEGAWTPDNDQSAPTAPAIIAGMDGHSALAAMGLERVLAE